MSAAAIASPLLDWHRAHGRHDLPWQRDVKPYRVWVSEVMLQQTQVQTVIPYFQRFMAHFPDVTALARAPADEVLHLWAGLGYYSRARNLQRSAQRIVAEFAGELPDDIEALQSLPGIGRSTAAAILALSRGRRHAILDGNVKRVLARVHAVEGAPSERPVEQRLWQLADAETPGHEVARYTQAIMDLGATVCTRARPLCLLCPLQPQCEAFRQGRVDELPTPRVRAARREKSVVMLLARRRDGSVWLERRPPSGIWGGLWSPPEFPDRAAARAAAGERFRDARVERRRREPLWHAFTHFDLRIDPLLADVRERGAAMEADGGVWYNPARPARIGLPAPVQTLLQALEEAAEEVMSRMIQCVVLKREAEGLDRPTYPGELGRRIYDSVSKEAWGRWVRHQIMLLNEYRLSPVDPKARKFLETEMEKYFFGPGSDRPGEYVAPKD